MTQHATEQLAGRPTWPSVIFWCVQLVVVIGGAAFLGPRIGSFVLLAVLGVVLALTVGVLAWGLVGALRTRVIVTDGMVLVRRAFTSDGFLLSEIRGVREASASHWIITLDDGSHVSVPMDITNHARIGAALLEAASTNRAQG